VPKAATTVTFVDHSGKEHVAFVVGTLPDGTLDLRYMDKDKQEIVHVYDIPRQTKRTKKVCWK